MKRWSIVQSRLQSMTRGRVRALKTTEFTQKLVLVVQLIHHLIVAYVILGWAIPSQSALLVYLSFIPLLYFHWYTNRGICVLTHLEHFFKTGSWDMSEYQAQAGFTGTLLKTVMGREPSLKLALRVAYSIPAIGWLIGLIRLIL